MSKLVLFVFFAALLSFCITTEAHFLHDLKNVGENLKDGVKGLGKKISEDWNVKGNFRSERNQKRKTSFSSDTAFSKGSDEETKTWKMNEEKFQDVNDNGDRRSFTQTKTFANKNPWRDVSKEDAEDLKEELKKLQQDAERMRQEYNTNEESTENTENDEEIPSLDETIDYATDFISQTADSVLNILANKGELKEFIKNSMDSTKEIRDQLNEAFQEWKKATEELNIKPDMTLDEVKNIFAEFFDDSFDKATNAASETIQTMRQTFRKSATVMKSTLKDWEKLGNELMEEMLEDLDEFFADLKENSEEDSHDEEGNNEETSVMNPEDEPVTVDVKIDVSLDLQKPQSGSQTEEKPAEHVYPSCMDEVVKSGALTLHAKEGNINDFSISCKTEECKRCLLWFYVTSQKNYQQMESAKEAEQSP